MTQVNQICKFGERETSADSTIFYTTLFQILIQTDSRFVLYKTRNSSGDEIPERDILLSLVRLTPTMEGFPGISQ